MSRRRRGFSVVEVLVVIAIIAIIAVLTMAAVQSAREAARRVSCRNNLKQLGIALASYASVHDAFPRSGGKGYSYIVMLLPQLEQTPLFNAINFSDNALMTGPGSNNRTVASSKLHVLLCPSDASHFALNESGTNYAGNHGVDRRDWQENGVFLIWGHRPVRLSEITDGLSQTVAVSEWVVGPGDPYPEPRDPLGSIFDLPPPLSGPTNLTQFAAACLAIDPAKQRIADNVKGQNWLYGGYSETLYNHNLGINAHSCTSEGFSLEGAYSASSRHAGGAHSLFADGHVKFFRTSLDRATWAALGTRNGGEVISDAE